MSIEISPLGHYGNILGREWKTFQAKQVFLIIDLSNFQKTFDITRKKFIYVDRFWIIKIMWIAIWRELFFPSLFSDPILIIAFDLVRIKFYLKLHFPEPMLQVESLKFVYFPMIILWHWHFYWHYPESQNKRQAIYSDEYVLKGVDCPS